MILRIKIGLFDRTNIIAIKHKNVYFNAILLPLYTIYQNIFEIYII